MPKGTLKNPSEHGSRPGRRGRRAQKVDKNYMLQKDARFAQVTRVKKHRAEATTQGLARTWKHWVEFYNLMHDENDDHHQRLQDAKLEDFRRYFDWRLTTGNSTTQSSIWTEWKFLLCVFLDETGQEVCASVRIEMHRLLNEQFVDEYDLDLTPKAKPVMSVEDLLVALHQLWAFNGSAFPIERQRVQVSLLLLMIAYTSSRPGALVEASSASGSNECLTYNDVRLLVIPNPEEPIRNVVIMEITLLYTKGNRQTKKPITYLFHEREDNLVLCPILHFLAIAFADEAFEAEGIRYPEDVYGLQVPAGRNCLQLRWKESMCDVPVFRRSVHTKDGIAISPVRSLGYSVFAKYIKNLGAAAGFRQLLTPYCLRRGTANAVNGTATDAERNQVLGHSRSEIFLRHYIQQQVRADVQSAYIGAARQALFRAVGRMSLDRDLRVPQSLTQEQKDEVRRSPQLVPLAKERLARRDDLICNHTMIKNSVGTLSYAEFLRVGRRYMSLEKVLLREKLDEARETFFEAIDTKEIEAQLASGMDLAVATDGEILAVAIPAHSFEERGRLAVALFGEVKIEDDNGSACRSRRCGAIRDMAALTFKKETLRLGQHLPRDTVSELPDVYEDDPNLFPVACPSNLCLFCLGNEDLLDISRTFSYSRKDSLSRHVHKTHLKYINLSAEFICPHPACNDTCKGHNGFKSHAALVHNVEHSV